MISNNNEILQAAKKNLDTLGNALGQKVGAELKDGKTSAVTNASAKFENFKKSFAKPVGTLTTIPEDVYKGIAEAFNGVNKSIFTKYSTAEGTLIKQLAATINKSLPKIADKKVPVKEDGKTVYYTIKFTLPANGVFTISKGKYSSTLSWKDGGTTAAKNAMAQYCVSLYNLEKSLSAAVLKEVGKVFTSKGAELFKLIFKGDVKESELKKFFGNSIYNKIKSDNTASRISSLMSALTNKKISNAVTQYEVANTAYNNLANELNTAKSTVSSIKTKESTFTTAAKKVQTSLKSLGVTVTLDALPAPIIGLTYDKKYTAVTLPTGYTSELKTSDYKSTVKTIDASSFTKAVTINGNAKDNTIFSGTGNDKLYGLGGKDVLYGGKGNDTLLGGASNDTIYGGVGKDSILGEAGADKLFGEDGDDTLNGGAGSDTLTGGKGKDVFIYTNGGGIDTITDYTAGEDKIKIASGSIGKVSMSGTTVTVKVGSGSIKIQNAKDKDITLVDTANKTSKYRNGKLISGGTSTDTSGGVTVTLSADTSGTFDLTTYNKTATKKAVNVDARASKNYLYLYGDDRANTIWAPNNVPYSYYTSYIYSGKGNDTIYCGNGYDDIYYYKGDGNETVYNFKTGNDIYLLDGVKFKNATLSGKDIIVNLDSGNTITLKNANNEQIYVGDAAGSYKFGQLSISGNTAVLNSDFSSTFRPSYYSANPVNIDARASKNNLALYGDDRANTIWAPNNVPYFYYYYSNIYAGKGNDTIYCGNGYDYIYYNKGDGNETVYDFKTGDDIYLRDGVKFKNVTLSGKDIIVNLDSGNTITLKNANNEQIYVGDAAGSYQFGQLSISGNTAVLNSDFSSTFRPSYYSANPVNVDARASKNYSTLYGDDRANTIWAPNNVPYYYDSNIYAGKGNDTIYCGSGYDDILYYKGDGNETVYNFKTGDDIYLRDVKFKNATLSGKDIIVNLDSGNTITLKDAKNEQVYIGGDDTSGNYVGTLTFASSSAKMTASANVTASLMFADTASANTDDLDALMNELPATNGYAEEPTIVTDKAEKLLNGVVFAQASTKK